MLERPEAAKARRAADAQPKLVLAGAVLAELPAIDQQPLPRKLAETAHRQILAIDGIKQAVEVSRRQLFGGVVNQNGRCAGFQASIADAS